MVGWGRTPARDRAQRNQPASSGHTTAGRAGLDQPSTVHREQRRAGRNRGRARKNGAADGGGGLHIETLTAADGAEGDRLINVAISRAKAHVVIPYHANDLQKSAMKQMHGIATKLWQTAGDYAAPFTFR